MNNLIRLIVKFVKKCRMKNRYNLNVFLFFLIIVFALSACATKKYPYRRHLPKKKNCNCAHFSMIKTVVHDCQS